MGNEVSEASDLEALPASSFARLVIILTLAIVVSHCKSKSRLIILHDYKMT